MKEDKNSEKRSASPFGMAFESSDNGIIILKVMYGWVEVRSTDEKSGRLGAHFRVIEAVERIDVVEESKIHLS